MKKETKITTVGDLIAALKELPEDARLGAYDSFDQDDGWVPALRVELGRRPTSKGYGGLVTLRLSPHDN